MLRKRFGWLLLIAGLLAIPVRGRTQEVQFRPAAQKPAESDSIFAPSVTGYRDILAPAPSIVRGQDTVGYEVPPVDFTGPLSHPRYEDGGFYTAAEFLWWRQTRPLRDQVVAIRGFRDFDGSIVGGTPGAFVGSGKEALNVNQIWGPGTFQPGTSLFLGWRFGNGVKIEANWWHLANNRFTATATLVPPGFNTGGALLPDTFLYSPVSNFPITFGVRPQNVSVGNPGATFGIWNAASQETIQFIQRFDLFQFNARVPVWETDRYRNYAIFGPRLISLWERFWWRTVSADVTGLSNNGTVADYTNIVSNRLYGVHAGSGHEWLLNDGPIGAWSLDLQLEGAMYADFIKGRAAYDRADKSVGAHRSQNMTGLVPGLDGKLGLMWYPWEAIQVRIGYSFMALFNTVASPRPIDFNYGTVNPEWTFGNNRLLHGVDMGVAFVW